MILKENEMDKSDFPRTPYTQKTLDSKTED
jgi:hypothetical protein